jgi:uncharacterized RDD family membrane protein YckC
MKCPKCEYLGFETGDRCKNCGYDFSLLLEPADALPDLDLRTPDDFSPAPDAWLNDLDREFGALEAPNEPAAPFEPFAPLARVARLAPVTPAHEAAIAPVAPTSDAPIAPASEESDARTGEVRVALPLFLSGSGSDDEPLIKLPASPRAPLAVRRTPETPRLRSMAKAVRKEPGLAFEFTDDAAESEPAPVEAPAARGRLAPPSLQRSSGPGRRLVAAAIDHAILLGIDAGVLYFTLKLASLTIADWRLVPVLPFLAFLFFLKFAYFAAFTAIGGQTIGKMTSGIRVIADDDTIIDASRALRRSLTGAVSLVTLGATFVPALFAADGRALHDRVAHTRVIAL